MPLYEVKVRKIVSEYYEVEAKNETAAKETWYTRGVEAGSVSEEVTVVSVEEAFADDGIEYDEDFEEGVDYDG